VFTLYQYPLIPITAYTNIRLYEYLPHLQNTERLELSIYLMGVCLIASTQLQNQNKLLKSGVVVFLEVFILQIAGSDWGRLSASQTS
jgi:hypothetical protein